MALPSSIIDLLPVVSAMKKFDKEPKEHNCPFCRFVGGITLLATSVFVAFHAKKTHRPMHRFVSSLLAAGFLGVGTARLFDLPPFHDSPPPPVPITSSWPDSILPPQEDNLSCIKIKPQQND